MTETESGPKTVDTELGQAVFWHEGDTPPEHCTPDPSRLMLTLRLYPSEGEEPMVTLVDAGPEFHCKACAAKGVLSAALVLAEATGGLARLLEHAPFSLLCHIGDAVAEVTMQRLQARLPERANQIIDAYEATTEALLSQAATGTGQGDEGAAPAETMSGGIL